MQILILVVSFEQPISIIKDIFKSTNLNPTESFKSITCLISLKFSEVIWIDYLIDLS